MKATGFSTIEILIAVFVFHLASVALLQGQWRARQQVVLAQQELIASALLFDIAATLQQLPELPVELQAPLQQPLAQSNNCQNASCSPSQQAMQSLQPLFALAFAGNGFQQAQLCISGNYPNTELNFSWHSQWLIQRDIGSGQCRRSGAFHQVQIKLRAQS